MEPHCQPWGRLLRHGPGPQGLSSATQPGAPVRTQRDRPHLGRALGHHTWKYPVGPDCGHTWGLKSRRCVNLAEPPIARPASPLSASRLPGGSSPSWDSGWGSRGLGTVLFLWHTAFLCSSVSRGLRDLQGHSAVILGQCQPRLAESRAQNQHGAFFSLVAQSVSSSLGWRLVWESFPAPRTCAFSLRFLKFKVCFSSA